MTRKTQRSAEDRFWSKVNRCGADECWLWKPPLRSDGYGRFWAGGVTVPPHRFSWELANERSADGAFVCHSCDNRACVNPAHLFLGDHRANMADMAMKGRAAKGAHDGNARLTDEQVMEARRLARAGVSQTELAKRFKVCRNAMRQCLTGHTWSHLPDALPVLDRRGESVPSAKLTEDAVRQIRARLLAGARGVDLAREFGVSKVAISQIKTRQRWGHVA